MRPEFCQAEGGFCAPLDAAGNAGQCPEGAEPVNLPGCGPGGVCCMGVPECVGHGGAIPLVGPDVADPPECCEPLETVACSLPGANGECMPGLPGCLGICVDCGDDFCGRGENPCNCPVDCQEQLPETCRRVGGHCVGGNAAGAAPVCPQGEEELDVPGCGPEAICCLGGAQCVPEGARIPVVPNAPECCDDLALIGCADLGPNGDCMEPPLGCAGVCADCPNEDCGPGENPCNCPVDCGDMPENACMMGGGMCVPPSPDGAVRECPAGTAEVDLGGCGQGAICCMGAPECVHEGGVIPVVQDPPLCCDGLAPIPCGRPMPNGDCLQPAGCGSICARCGNNECGPGESRCNCPADCGNEVVNPCEAADGVCAQRNNFGVPNCPADTVPGMLPGCPPTQACCVPAAAGID